MPRKPVIQRCRSFLLEKIRGMPSPGLVSLALEALNRHDRSWQLDVPTAGALTKIYESADDPRRRSQILRLLQSADLRNVASTASARESMGALLRDAAIAHQLVEPRAGIR